MSSKDSKGSPKDAKAPAPAPAPAPEAAAPAEGEVAAPKVRKERKEKKPKANVQVWKLYKASDDGATMQRLRKECPRCGRGYFMAEHKDRLSCGHCGYTTFKNK